MPNPQEPELRRSEENIRPRVELGPDPGDVGGETGPVPPDNQPGHHPEQEQDKPPAEKFAAAMGIKPDTEVDPGEAAAEDTRRPRRRTTKKAAARKATSRRAAAGGDDDEASTTARGGRTGRARGTAGKAATSAAAGAGGAGPSQAAAASGAATGGAAASGGTGGAGGGTSASGSPASSGAAPTSGTRATAGGTGGTSGPIGTPGASGPGAGTAQERAGQEPPQQAAAQHHHALPDEQLPHDAGMVTPSGAPITKRLVTWPVHYWKGVLKVSTSVTGSYVRAVRKVGERLIPGRR